MGIFAFLFVGLIAGSLAGLITGGRGFGIIGDIIVGVLGALVGGHILGWFGVFTYGMIGSIAAAIVRCRDSPLAYSTRQARLNGRRGARDLEELVDSLLNYKRDFSRLIRLSD